MVSDNRFNEIYEKYRLLVMEISLSILGNRESAEDSLQLTFISVAKNMDKIDSDQDKTRNYIAATAHNTALKYLKKEKKHIQNNEPFPEERGEEESSSWKEKEVSSDSFEEKVINRIFLFECLEKIDKKYSDILIDFYLNELSIKNIADKYRISEALVKTRLSRSKKKLQKLYTKTLILPASPASECKSP